MRVILRPLIACTLVLAACNTAGPDDPGPQAASVSVTLANSTVQQGGQVTASAVVRDADGQAIIGHTIEWSTVAPTIASISATGVVTGVGAGTTTVVARVGSASGSAPVFVVTRPPAAVHLSMQVDTLLRYGLVDATAVIIDELGNAVGGRVDWSSSNPSVAIVNQGGRVTLVAPGTATITAQHEGVSDSRTVTVPPVVSVLIAGELRAKVGDGTQFLPIIYGPDERRLGLPATWSVLDPAFGAIAPNGVFTPARVGNATLHMSVAGVTSTRSVETYDWTVMRGTGSIIATLPVQYELQGTSQLARYPTLSLSCIDGVLAVGLNTLWTGGTSAPITYLNIGQPVPVTWLGGPNSIVHPGPTNDAVRAFLPQLTRWSWLTFTIPAAPRTLVFRPAGAQALIDEVSAACP